MTSFSFKLCSIEFDRFRWNATKDPKDSFAATHFLGRMLLIRSSIAISKALRILPNHRTMTISTTEHLKQRAIEVLDEKIERRIIPAGDVLPDVTVKSFDGTSFPISQLYKEKPLLLIFLRASW